MRELIFDVIISQDIRLLAKYTLEEIIVDGVMDIAIWDATETILSDVVQKYIGEQKPANPAPRIVENYTD